MTQIAYTRDSKTGAVHVHLPPARARQIVYERTPAGGLRFRYMTPVEQLTEQHVALDAGWAALAERAGRFADSDPDGDRRRAKKNYLYYTIGKIKRVYKGK